ncbi:MAG: hypothetical protein JO297_09950, partial [Nitrososphaeraceae archaeon]|nr:hypothetical protein [Nitrososphaeraceae archaeon]
MSLGTKKKDKESNSGGEASANYMIGGRSGGGRSETGKEEPPEATAENKVPNNQEVAIRKEKVTTALPPREEAQPDTIAKTTTKDILRDQNQDQQQYQSQQQHRGHQQSINAALNESRDNIRRHIDEARREIPRYTQAANEYQEQTIQASRELADNYIESQKEIINSLQSAWLPQIEAANRLFTTSWVSPRNATEIYANMVSSFADNIIAATRLVNNMMFANMNIFKNLMLQAKHNVKELSRIGVSTAKTFEQTSR